MSVKAITVRFHLDHPAEKQAWEKLVSLRNERHLSFSQAVTDALNAYGADTLGLSNADKEQLAQAVSEAVAIKLQQMLPAYLAGYSAGVNVAPNASVMPTLPKQAQTFPEPGSEDTMPDFDDSCMDFDFIGG